MNRREILGWKWKIGCKGFALIYRKCPIHVDWFSIPMVLWSVQERLNFNQSMHPSRICQLETKIPEKESGTGSPYNLDLFLSFSSFLSSIWNLNSLVGLVPVNMINAVRQIVAPSKWTMRNRDIFQKALDVLLAPLHLRDMFMSMWCARCFRLFWFVSTLNPTTHRYFAFSAEIRKRNCISISCSCGLRLGRLPFILSNLHCGRWETLLSNMLDSLQRSLFECQGDSDL